jgi:hypothetical protein
MKRKENRLNVRRLFVLGAGASHSASTSAGGSPERRTPLDKDFCRMISELDPDRPVWVGPAREYIVREWKDHVPFEEFGLEQAIIRQLGHLEFIDAIHPRRRNTAVTDFKYLNRLSHLICFTLRRGREKKDGPYRHFAEEVFPEEQAFGQLRDRVITFNYDELLDKHLLSRFDIRQVYFDRLCETQSSVDRRAEHYPNPLVVKLHGSVNWRCSTEEFENIVRNVSNDNAQYWIKSIWYSQVGTPSPEDDSSPLIMPPLPVKPITRIKLFCFLWTKAYEYLHEAEELVICGYSLPDADRLAQSMFANFANKSLRAVTIIDPNPTILSKWRALLKRKNINGKARWTYFEDFKEYVDVLGV